MESVLASLPQASRVAVVRLRSLGDCVLTTPALHILKHARPDLRIAVVVEDRFRELFEGNPDVDATLPPESSAVRRFAPWLCLNLHGGTTSAWITAVSGAPIRAGFAHFRNRLVYHLRIPRAQEILGAERKVHTAEHLASAIFYLGAERCEIPRARLFVAPGPARPAIPIAVIHPFAAAPEKTWPADRFIAVAEHLERSGMEPVFVGGAGDDFSPFGRRRTIAGRSLASLKSLLSCAALFVGNDSGPAHMAAAFGLPVVVVFSASDPEIWGPWRTPSQIVRAPATTGQVLEALARLQVAA